MAKPSSPPGQDKPHGGKPPVYTATMMPVIGKDTDGDGVLSQGDYVKFTFDPPDTRWGQITVTLQQNGQTVLSGSLLPGMIDGLALESGNYTSGAAQGHAVAAHSDAGDFWTPVAECDFEVAA
jgi:hypothetical protein